MTDKRLEGIVANLLRTGVILSASVVLAGGIWYLASNRGPAPSYSAFQPRVSGLHSVAVLPGPQAMILAGLLLLIATPVARVAFTVVAFILERDHVYVGVTVLVLLILLYSIGTSWL
jgi:uncharacterized membrane protein